MVDRASLPSLTDWIAQLFEQPKLTQMGHAQRTADLNLGLGWLYYGLARTLRPTTAVVIGSYRGFVPLVLGRALSDNGESGRVIFIDPSLVDDFWKNEAEVQAYFRGLGVANISHHLMTTQEFVGSPADLELEEVGLVFVDGFHSAEQARFDFEAFADRLTPGGMILLHDSVWRLPTGMYGAEREYVYSVVDFVTDLKRQPQWQVLDVPFGDGVTVVRRTEVGSPPARRRKTAAKPMEGALP